MERKQATSPETPSAIPRIAVLAALEDIGLEIRHCQVVISARLEQRDPASRARAQPPRTRLEVAPLRAALLPRARCIGLAALRVGLRHAMPARLVDVSTLIARVSMSTHSATRSMSSRHEDASLVH